MTGQVVTWFKYGELTDGDRIEATIRKEYETGLLEGDEPDDIRKGTIPMRTLAFLGANEEIQKRMTDDGEVVISNLSPESQEKVFETFEEE